MPVSGVVQLPPVSGVEIPVTAFIDDTHVSVYTITDGTVRTTAVHDVKDDGVHAIVTGLALGTEVVTDVDSANVGNGDTVTTGATPAPAAGAKAAGHKHVK
jgi:hypothetical protein